MILRCLTDFSEILGTGDHTVRCWWVPNNLVLELRPVGSPLTFGCSAKGVNVGILGLICWPFIHVSVSHQSKPIFFFIFNSLRPTLCFTVLCMGSLVQREYWIVHFFYCMTLDQWLKIGGKISTIFKAELLGLKKKKKKNTLGAELSALYCT